jgi:hypothetical protein
MTRQTRNHKKGQFLQFKVGDGSKIYMRLDSWHLDGILYDLYGYRVVYDARSKLDAKLSKCY